MSRITKQLAENIATKLTEKSRKVYENLLVEYQSLVLELYKAQIPKEVMEVAAKYPDWVYSTRSVRLQGHGFNWEFVSVRERVACNTNTEAHLKLNDKIAGKLMTAKRKYEKAKADCKALRQEVETALVNLRTYKQVEEHLPAARPYLPPPLSNALVVNFDSLVKKLGKQPEVVAEKTVTK